MSRTNPTFGAARRGSVIVVVLVTLLLASLMIVKFMESSAVELTLATRQADRERLRGDAYAALETELAVLAEIKAIDKDLYAPEQGWGDPYAYASETPREGVTVSYTFTDESGKASLPQTTFDDMVELAQVLGLGEPDARRFSDALYAWMTADHVSQDIDAEASRYERDDPPITVPKRSLRSWDELHAVKVARDYVYDEHGALTPFGAALHENVSLYDFEGSNVNALAPALGTSRGWDAKQAAQLAGYRAGEGSRPAGAPTWFRGIEDVATVLGANADTKGLDATVKLLHITATVREGLASMSLSTLVAVADGVALPDAATPATEGAATGSTNATAGQTAGGQTTGGQANAKGGKGNTKGGNTKGGNAKGGNAQGGKTKSGGGASGGASGGKQTAEKLDYPFTILEVFETSAPPPLVSPAVEDPSP